MFLCLTNYPIYFQQKFGSYLENRFNSIPKTICVWKKWNVEMIEGMPIPISCPSCSGKMIAIRYEPAFNFLKVRSWQICKECNFERSADDFKNSLLTVWWSMNAWKCYRCNLVFTKESLVVLHMDISDHPLRKIELLDV